MGKSVELHSLGKAELNGLRGSAASYDEVKQRFAIDLDNGRQVAVKPENVCVCSD